MTPSRVAVTGASGFIGRALLHARPSGWHVVAISRRHALPDAVAASHGRAGVDWIRLADPTDALPPALQEPFDAVIHLAGSADHGLAVRAPWEDLRATGITAAALLGRLRARHVVVLSSAAVYAGLTGRVDPSMCVEPRMAYALSKRYVEGLVAALAANGSIVSWTVLRLYNAYGPGERPTRLVPRIATAIATGAPFILTGSTTSLSDPVHVDDVVRALVAAVARPASGTFDLAGGDPTPLGEQVGRIAAILGQPALPVVTEANATEEPIHFWSDVGGLVDALQVPPPEPLASGVRRYAEQAGWLPATRPSPS